MGDVVVAFAMKLPVHGSVRVYHRPYRKLWRKEIWVHCWHCDAKVLEPGSLEPPCRPYRGEA